MQEINFEDVLDGIVTADGRYDREAYFFVRDALDHTQRMIHKRSRGQIRHVSGGELLDGIREFALRQFGPMTITVLNEWGVRTTRDFGEIVFNMVDAGLLAKTQEDSRADFEGVYDFDEVFRQPFLPRSKQASPKRPASRTTHTEKQP